MNRKNAVFFLLGSFLGLIILFLLLTVGVVAVKIKYRGRVYPKVFLFNKDFSGKTIGEADIILEREKEHLAATKITLTYQPKEGERKQWEILPKDINFRLDKDEIGKQLFLKGKLFNWVNLFQTYKLLMVPKTVQPTYLFEESKLKILLGQINQTVGQSVEEPRFEFKDGRVVDFQAAKEGLIVDEEVLIPLIISALSSYPYQERELNLPMKKVLPKINTANSNDLGINELLAEGESFFKDSIPTRVHNILLASGKFHGLVISPGETFSFAQSIGEISQEVGYQQAYVIKEKKTILEDGGGVCQVSTTLFRAALNAGLPIIERHAHYYRVGFYEQGGYPPGLDATVYPPSPDLKFQNDTPAYLLIQTKIDKLNKSLTFQFYGTSDGRKVEVAKPVILSQTPPPEPIYTDDPTLTLGVVKRFDSAHWGAKVSVVRKVYSADGNLKEERTFLSNYFPWAAVYLRGTKVN